MSRISNVNRIILEDYPAKDREIISRLATVLNLFMEETVNVVNGNIDYDNIKRQLVQFDVIVDANGKPITTTRFNSDSQIKGKTIVDIQNLTNSAIYPTASPFVTTSAISTQIYEVKNIIGLVPNQKYRITLELIF